MNHGNLSTKPMPGVTGYTQGWEHFDNLPRKYKELAWEGPRCFIPVDLSQPVKDMKADMEKEYAKDTLRVYGPDHPQAWKGK